MTVKDDNLPYSQLLLVIDFNKLKILALATQDFNSIFAKGRKKELKIGRNLKR
ncbi:MAG: hypothetical protein Q4G13_06885 [Moraxella sp.]|nr:hypothetical protein [Moraxella sp.]